MTPDLLHVLPVSAFLMLFVRVIAMLFVFYIVAAVLQFACTLVQQTRSASKARDSALDLAWTLRVTADDLDPVGVHLVRVVKLEVDILDNERPNVVAETVGIEVALHKHVSVCHATALDSALRCSKASVNPP